MSDPNVSRALGLCERAAPEIANLLAGPAAGTIARAVIQAAEAAWTWQHGAHTADPDIPAIDHHAVTAGAHLFREHVNTHPVVATAANHVKAAARALDAH